MIRNLLSILRDDEELLGITILLCFGSLGATN
jgi:hypothetical protein